MKKTILSLVVVLMAVIAVSAQQPEQAMKPGDHPAFRKYGRDRIAKKLNFSDQQKDQLKNINSDYHKKVSELRKHEEITVREMKSQLAALHQQHREQIAALLTPAQKDQLAKMKQQGIAMAKVNAGARAEKLKIKLGLSDAQAGQLKTIRTDMAAKMKLIHTDNTLSQEQKREQFKTLVTAQKEQLKSILTAEQLQQLEQLKQQRHRRDFSK